LSTRRWQRLKAAFRHAFALEGRGPLSDEERALLERLALAIVARRMGAPAVLFLSSLRPLNYVGSQAMIFLRPFLTPLFNPKQYERLAAILERREGIAALIQVIEAAQEER